MYPTLPDPVHPTDAAATLAQIEASVRQHDTLRKSQDPNMVHQALSLQLHYRNHEDDSDNESYGSGSNFSDFSPLESPILPQQGNQAMEGNFSDIFSNMVFQHNQSRQRSRSIGNTSDTNSIESTWSLPLTSFTSPASSIPAEYQSTTAAVPMGESLEGDQSSSELDDYLAGRTLVDLDPTPVCLLVSTALR